MRRLLVLMSVGVGLAMGAWLGVRAVEARRFREDLARARAEFGAQRFATARKRLVRLAERRPGDGEVELLRGECERRLGHPDAALAAWGRVPDGTEQAAPAALASGRMALGLGRLRLAEARLLRASRAGGDVADEAWRLLDVLYWLTGRRDEQRAVLRARAEREADPSKTLRELWSIDRDPYPVVGITAALAKARRSTPGDDLVWLASADLAIRTGRFDEAGAWLDRCERARPDDPAVWRARLEWAKGVGRPEEVRRAAAHLPAPALPRATMLATRVWLAARDGDRQAERSALEALLALEPANDAALERLADLAAQAGEPGKVAELRRRKAAMDAVVDRYRRLIQLPEKAPHAAELARTAEEIGRWFDARTWWALAARRDASAVGEARAAITRLAARNEAVRPTGGRTLADLLGPGLTGGRPTDSGPHDPVIPTFVDEAAARGLVYRFDHGPSEEHQLPETMSGGVAVLDFDGDGWLDIYALQGGPFPPRESPPPFGDRLFRNRGDGRFLDVTAASGLAALPGGYGHGVAVGDFDNDGRPDLFVTRWRSYALYRNLGGGRFEDATARAGLGGDRDWPTSAAWADFDDDGDLDLYVCHYLKWDAENPTLCEYPERSKPGYMHCDPLAFPALPDHLFRNEGGRFIDVSAEAGLVDRDGRGLGVVADDLDDDGKVDLFVANDLSANLFYRNLGGFRFTEQAMEAGLAASGQGGYLAGMGTARGDFDGDGRLDLAVTNFHNEATTLYHDHGGGLFSDRSADAGLAVATRQFLGFGVAALDANNDGRLDLVQANGHVSDFSPAFPYEMTAQLLLGDATGRFRDASRRAGPPWQVPRLGRGLAVGDMDNDGRMDVLVVGQGAPLALLVNQPTPAAGRFLTLALEGVASNRDGVGARVTVSAGGRDRVAARFGGGSYLSASDPRLHFGLGAERRVDRVEVRWPSGRRDTYEGLTAGTGYRLREGDPTPEPLAGFAGDPAGP
ncbi:FG-GAP-like repeat-containing protein [Tautonia plasticadhaerens]|uniref:FG-GAP repeat protein n=1 Tax=Tautonia plasticadhaerens TaxID=2527974 RepID=A0A518H9X0_9BACT|nr:FG-GAP-like repeat-containing protein [Tautonia plasticadhaerens]QDV37651.1 FG-GAP repeat protein [Tautonia plasticadhaerens]